MVVRMHDFLIHLGHYEWSFFWIYVMRDSVFYISYEHKFSLQIPSARIKGKGLEAVKPKPNEVFLKPYSLVQISCKSDCKQKCYWRLKI